MLAQLLGMGRGKKEKDKEREKEPASHKTGGFTDGGAGHAGAKEVVAFANGTPASSGKLSYQGWVYTVVVVYRSTVSMLIGSTTTVVQY